VTRALSNQVIQIFCFLAGVVVIHCVNVLIGMWLTQLGVIPRSIVGLRGILFSPLLHRDWAHLIANAAPMGVMLCLLALSRGRYFWPTVAALWLASGIGVWLVGRPGSIQIGASGLIYALAVFLVATAWFQRNLKSALAAIVVVFLYGGIVWGLLPGRHGVSWEGHLAGAIAGVLVALPSRRERLKIGPVSASERR
jgi:membrane associated rhomboid family serine protease